MIGPWRIQREKKSEGRSVSAKRSRAAAPSLSRRCVMAPASTKRRPSNSRYGRMVAALVECRGLPVAIDAGLPEGLRGSSAFA